MKTERVNLESLKIELGDVNIEEKKDFKWLKIKFYKKSLFFTLIKYFIFSICYFFFLEF